MFCSPKSTINYTSMYCSNILLPHDCLENKNQTEKIYVVVLLLFITNDKMHQAQVE